MWEMRKNASPAPISTILITESQLWYVCVGLHLLSSEMLLYLIFHVVSPQHVYICSLIVYHISHTFNTVLAPNSYIIQLRTSYVSTEN